MHSTSFTPNMNMDPWTAPYPYSTQSTKVDKWTHQKTSIFTFFNGTILSSMNNLRNMKTTFLISSTTYKLNTRAQDLLPLSPIQCSISVQHNQQTQKNPSTWYVHTDIPFSNTLYNIQFCLFTNILTTSYTHIFLIFQYGVTIYTAYQCATQHNLINVLYFNIDFKLLFKLNILYL